MEHRVDPEISDVAACLSGGGTQLAAIIAGGRAHSEVAGSYGAPGSVALGVALRKAGAANR